MYINSHLTTSCNAFKQVAVHKVQHNSKAVPQGQIPKVKFNKHVKRKNSSTHVT